MTQPRPARLRDPAEQVRPLASALLTAGGWALARRNRTLGAALIAASLILVARQSARAATDRSR